MTAPCGPAWAGRYAAGGRRERPDPAMRVSDAERSEVADVLSTHYGDGRLDETEFNERLERAMKSKTRGDLDALLSDLPGASLSGASLGPDGAGAEAPPGVQARHRQRALPVVLLIVLGIVLAHALARPFVLFPFPFVVPWLLIAALAFVWLRGGRRRSRR